MSGSDIAEIQNLLARLNWAIDAGDGVAYASYFTDDGVFDLGAIGRFEGREAIAAVVSSFAPAVPGMRHWVCNQFVEVDGDTATSREYLVVLLGRSEPGFGPSGSYTDRLRRTPDGWRFVDRTFYADGEPGIVANPIRGRDT